MNILVKFFKKYSVLLIFAAFLLTFFLRAPAKKIKYIGFDIHDVLIHLNMEKGSPKPMDYQAIVISISQQLKNEYQFAPDKFDNIAKNIGVVMKNSMPILLPQLLPWVSTAAEQSELGKIWFSKRFIVTDNEISESVEQIIKSDNYNNFVDQLLDNSLNVGISELASELNNDQASVKTTLIRILKNGLIKNISNMVVKGFYDITTHARMAEPIQPMPKLLQLLKNKGYSLFIISNAASGIVKEQYMKKAELAELFQCFEDDKIIVSGEVGLKKPDPAIFEYAAKKFGFKYSECLFVDDEQPIVDAANKLGITGIRFDRKKIAEFLETLKNLSIINDEDIKEILGYKIEKN